MKKKKLKFDEDDEYQSDHLNIETVIKNYENLANLAK